MLLVVGGFGKKSQEESEPREVSGFQVIWMCHPLPSKTIGCCRKEVGSVKCLNTRYPMVALLLVVGGFGEEISISGGI